VPSESSGYRTGRGLGSRTEQREAGAYTYASTQSTRSNTAGWYAFANADAVFALATYSGSQVTGSSSLAW